MKKIQYNGQSKILNGICTKINAIIDSLITDVKVNNTSVITNHVANITMPTKVSDLENDSHFIDNTVNNLVNYYTETEVDDLISHVAGMHFLVVQELPTEDIDTNTIYLVPKQDSGQQDIYEEWIYIVEEAPLQSHWELIGSTDIDLSNYVQKSLTVGLIKNDGTIDQTQYATMSDIPDELADLSDDSTHRVVTDTEKSTWNDKRAVNLELTNEDLNDVKTVGFYVGKSGNTCTNKPSGFNQFGLIVVKTATSSDQYYKQIMVRPNAEGEVWTRTCIRRSTSPYDSVWSDWVKSEFTDEKVTQTNNTENKNFPVLFANSNNDTTETAGVNKNLGVYFNPSTGSFRLAKNHTSTTSSASQLVLGNNIANGTAGSVYGVLAIYPKNANWTKLVAGEASNTRTYYLPIDKPNNSELAVTSDIPDELADLADDANHRLVTDTQISSWNGKVGTDENVKQSQLGSTNSNYPLLMAYSANGTEETKAVWKDTNITYNPSTQKFTVFQAEFGILQATTYDIGLGSNIKATIHHNAVAESKVETYLPIVNGELALEEWQNKIGSMNLIPLNTYHKSGYMSGGTSNSPNTTFTVNSDGTILATRTATNGTATFYLTEQKINGGLFLPNGTYYISGCPAGGSTSTSSGYQLGVRCQKNNATYQLVNEAGGGATFTVNGDDFSSEGAWVRVMIVIRANATTGSNLWKPMITLTSLANKRTYCKPSLSNRQLTYNKFDISNVASIENTNTASKAYAVGDYLILSGQLYRVTTAIANGGEIIAYTVTGVKTANITVTTVMDEIKRAMQ